MYVMYLSGGRSVDLFVGWLPGPSRSVESLPGPSLAGCALCCLRCCPCERHTHCYVSVGSVSVQKGTVARVFCENIYRLGVESAQ